jgi:hypothetical protein
MFVDAEANHRALANEAIAFWSALYKVEGEATAQHASAAERLAMRQEKSALVVADFREWLDKCHDSLPPQEPISKALNYLHSHWAALTRFLEDGRIPIENNAAERALRAIAVGRENYPFAGSNHAAERSAMFYTFVETCRFTASMCQPGWPTRYPRSPEPGPPSTNVYSRKIGSQRDERRPPLSQPERSEPTGTRARRGGWVGVYPSHRLPRRFQRR